MDRAAGGAWADRREALRGVGGAESGPESGDGRTTQLVHNPAQSVTWIAQVDRFISFGSSARGFAEVVRYLSLSQGHQLTRQDAALACLFEERGGEVVGAARHSIPDNQGSDLSCWLR